MFFKDNPFYLLGVHTPDSGDRVEEALREKLHRAEGEAERKRLLDAAYVLQKSVKRSGAEFFWLPGLSKEEALGLVERTVQGQELSGSDFLSLPPLSRVILAMNGLFYGSAGSRLLLQEICANYGHIHPEEAAALFNGDRRLAGMPQLRNASHVEMWKRELPHEMVEAAREAGKEMKLSGQAHLLAELRKEKDTFPWQLLVIDYEERSRKERERLERDLDYGLSLSGRHFPQGLLLAKDTLAHLKDLSEPLCIRSGRWPLETAFQRVRREVTALWDRGRKEDSRVMAESLLSFFREWPDFAERAEKDIKDMAEGKRPEEVPSGKGPAWQNVPSTLRRIPEVERKKEKKVPLFVLFLVFFAVMTLCYIFSH